MNEFKQAWAEHANVNISQQYHKVRKKAVSFDKKLMQTIDVVDDSLEIASMDAFLPFDDLIDIGYAAYNILDILS